MYFFLKAQAHPVVLFENHLDGVVVLDKVVLPSDEELVDARDVDVHLGQPFILLQKSVEDLVEVSNEVPLVVGGEDGLRDHVLDLTDLQILPCFLNLQLVSHQHHP